MISRDDVQQLLQRPHDGRPVLSVFLDMSVTADNKRTHAIYLNRWRTQPPEPEVGDGGNPVRADIGEAYQRVERWLDERFDESNKGIAVYAEVGGGWLRGLQLPVPLVNRSAIRDEPVVGPLVEVLDSEQRYGVILVDREHLRLFSLYLGRIMDEHEVRTEPYPTSHSIQRGGYSQPLYQSRKAEEVRQFFKDFALEAGEFDQRSRPDSFILLGTDENVKNFMDVLPASIRDRVVHTRHAAMDASSSELIRLLEPFIAMQREQSEAAIVDLLRERVRQSHFAVANFHDTLEQLQEGKVQTLVLARDLQRTGARCSRCHFLLARDQTACPYCGDVTVRGVDLVEAMIRLARDQDVPIRYAPADALAGLNGVGALLRF
jgi:peptide subunit release factor 1 (eRF1)